MENINHIKVGESLINKLMTKLLTKKELDEYIPEFYGKFNDLFIVIKSKDKPKGKIGNPDSFVWCYRKDITSILFLSDVIKPFDWNNVIIVFNTDKIVIGWTFPTINYSSLADLY